MQQTMNTFVVLGSKQKGQQWPFIFLHPVTRLISDGTGLAETNLSLSLVRPPQKHLSALFHDVLK